VYLRTCFAENNHQRTGKSIDRNFALKPAATSRTLESSTPKIRDLAKIVVKNARIQETKKQF